MHHLCAVLIVVSKSSDSSTVKEGILPQRNFICFGQQILLRWLCCTINVNQDCPIDSPILYKFLQTCVTSQKGMSHKYDPPQPLYQCNIVRSLDFTYFLVFIWKAIKSFPDSWFNTSKHVCLRHCIVTYHHLYKTPATLAPCTIYDTAHMRTVGSHETHKWIASLVHHRFIRNNCVSWLR